MSIPVKGSNSYITAQLIVGELECALVGASYTAERTADEAARYANKYADFGGISGALMLGVAEGVEGAILGAPGGPLVMISSAGFRAILGFVSGYIIGIGTGLTVGAAKGAGKGLYDGTSYTIKICSNYAEKCRTLRNLEHDDAQFQKVALNTKRVMQQFFYNFYEKAHEEVEDGNILCPISQEIMLYPAVLATCQVKHVHELASLHQLLLKKGKGVGRCSICRAKFTAKDIDYCFETHKKVREVVKESFEFIRSTKENLLLIRQLNQEIGLDVWGYLTNHPIEEPISHETEEKIFNKTPLSIEELRTIYPAFRSICTDLNQTNNELSNDMLTNFANYYSVGMISEEKYRKLCTDTIELKIKNTIIVPQ